MKILNILVICFLVLTQNVFSQTQVRKKFTVQGTINSDTGTVKLIMLADSSFYRHPIMLSSKVENGRFTFNGLIDEPQGVLLRFENRYESAMFLITSGHQSIKVDTRLPGKPPEVKDYVYQDEINDYTASRIHFTRDNDLFRRQWDSLDKVYNRQIPSEIKLKLERRRSNLYARSDSLLLAHVIRHPDSYLGLWKLINLASFSGYEKVFDAIFNNFSPKLKQSYPGTKLAEMLRVSRSASLGKVFQLSNFFDRQSKQIDTRFFSKNRFTLIDFWYSNCSPCIAQFPELKEIYGEFSEKSFQILGISTDKNQYVPQWEKVIEMHSLTWPQYRDPGGLEASKIGINAFPTNFLVNERGIVVAKNISLIELKDLLKRELN
ncbi:TlpA disulfide reductase family protein [Pedobacter sp. P351]|uniref:TlpA disulfide reductase family protein n=1 Tax=Pedobacter superstes TaxID=3133441 RepID=UPI0030990CDB